jgi:hypothetical protein
MTRAARPIEKPSGFSPVCIVPHLQFARDVLSIRRFHSCHYTQSRKTRLNWLCIGLAQPPGIDAGRTIAVPTARKPLKYFPTTITAGSWWNWSVAGEF